MSHSFFIQPTDLCNTFHNYFFLIEIGPIFYRWQNENNQKIFDYHLPPPSLLRWENILNHFPQNLYQTIWRREKFYHFDKQAFWISELKNYFPQEVKTEPEMVSADSEEWTKGSFERNYWVMWLHVLFMYWQLFMKKQSFISVLAAS